MTEKKRQRKKGNLSQIMKRLRKNKFAMFGLAVFAIEIMIVIFAPVIAPYGYADMNLMAILKSPCKEHLFGTDSIGHDLFSCVLYGGRYSLIMGVSSTVGATLVGMIIGAIAGFFGGKLDNLIMRILDIVQAIPGILLCIVISAAFGGSVLTTVIAMIIAGIAGNARLFRASILNIRTAEYIEASEAINCSKGRIILKHIVPNALSPMIVNGTMSIAGNIILAASLSFIGLGVQPPTPEWGALLSSGYEYMRQAPWLVICPGVAIMITVFSLNILGDGLRDAMDPKLKD